MTSSTTSRPLVLPRAVEPDPYRALRWIAVPLALAFSVASWFALLFSPWFLGEGPIGPAGLLVFLGTGMLAAAGAAVLYAQVPRAPCSTARRACVGIGSTFFSLALITLVLMWH